MFRRETKTKNKFKWPKIQITLNTFHFFLLFSSTVVSHGCCFLCLKNIIFIMKHLLTTEKQEARWGRERHETFQDVQHFLCCFVSPELNADDDAFFRSEQKFMFRSSSYDLAPRVASRFSHFLRFLLRVSGKRIYRSAAILFAHSASSSSPTQHLAQNST